MGKDWKVVCVYGEIMREHEHRERKYKQLTQSTTTTIKFYNIKMETGTANEMIQIINKNEGNCFWL